MPYCHSSAVKLSVPKLGLPPRFERRSAGCDSRQAAGNRCGSSFLSMEKSLPGSISLAGRRLNNNSPQTGSPGISVKLDRGPPIDHSAQNQLDFDFPTFSQFRCDLNNQLPKHVE